MIDHEYLLLAVFEEEFIVKVLGYSLESATFNLMKKTIAFDLNSFEENELNFIK